MKKILLIDMYGVIIEESKGNFIPYTYDHFDEKMYPEITKKFREEHLFTKAQKGELSAEDFLTRMGFARPREAMQDYLDHYLTLDPGFVPFAGRIISKYELVLLSNDLGEWSEYLTGIYGLNRFFRRKFVSSDIHMRKPSDEMMEYCLWELGVAGESCVFVDNSVKNLDCAERFGVTPILFNRDGEEYSGRIANDFDELERLL